MSRKIDEIDHFCSVRGGTPRSSKTDTARAPDRTLRDRVQAAPESAALGAGRREEPIALPSPRRVCLLSSCAEKQVGGSATR